MKRLKSPGEYMHYNTYHKEVRLGTMDFDKQEYANLTKRIKFASPIIIFFDRQVDYNFQSYSNAMNPIQYSF